MSIGPPLSEISHLDAGCPVQFCDAVYVAGLQVSEFFAVFVRHQLPPGERMIEPDSVADLVHQHVTQIVDVKIAVETDLPSP